MKCNELLNYLEERVAPVALSDQFCAKYKWYDNSGIIVDCGTQIAGALFSLDFSYKAARRAREQKMDVLITHHPAIYTHINRVDAVQDDRGRALSECLAGGINVISMHLNFDAAHRGLDYYLMKALGGESALGRSTLKESTKFCLPCGDCGYGRAYDIAETSFNALIERVLKNIGSKQCLAFGDKNRKIARVASFCGSGCDDEAMAFAKAEGVDLFVSSDLKEHQIANLMSNGINVLQLTHYAAENYGFMRIYEDIKDGLSIRAEYFCDQDLL